METMTKINSHMKQLIDKLSRCITQEINLLNGKILLFYFACISILELLAYLKKGFFSFTASRIWLFTGIICLIFFIYDVVIKILRDARKHYFVAWGGFILLIGIFCYYIGNIQYSDINYDATQQIAAGLDAFSVNDWNYTGTAFLGYPNRQYLIAALPAVFLGRSITALHLGFAYPFLIGLTMLFTEIKDWLKEWDMDENLALIPLYAIPAFRFIPEYFMNFEQAITPVALTMMGIALFMKLCRRPTVIGLVSLSWTGCLFCDSYTPAVASLGLLLCFLFLYMISLIMKNRSGETEKPYDEKAMEKTNHFSVLIKVTGGLIINIACFFLATFLSARSDRLGSAREDVSLVSLALESWEEFFTDTNAMFFGIFLGIVLLYMFLSLLGRLKFYDFAISCWVLGVVLFANYITGYMLYEKMWLMQRNMIVIPVLTTGIFLTIARFLKQYALPVKKSGIFLIVLFFSINALSNFGKEHQSFVFYKYVQPLKYMISFSKDTLREYEIKDTEEFNIILFTDNEAQKNIYDYAKFFYPNAQTYSLKSGESLPEIDWGKPTFFFAENGQTLSGLNFTIDSRVYKNTRYKTQAIWYRCVYTGT